MAGNGLYTIRKAKADISKIFRYIYISISTHITYHNYTATAVRSALASKST